MAAIRTLLFVFLTALLSLLVAASAVTNVTMATIAAANVTLTTTEEVAVTIQDLTADDHLEEVSVAVLATTEEQQEPPATVPRPGPLLLSLQKRHAYSRGNDIKKNKRCHNRHRRRACKKARSKNTRKACSRRERKCRAKISNKCRRSPICSRRQNKRCGKKYDRCISHINQSPPKTSAACQCDDPNEPPKPRPTKKPTEVKKNKEQCQQTSDCLDGLCCTHHGHGQKLCKPFIKIHKICTRTFDRKRSADNDVFEQCPCEVGLRCMASADYKHYYTCQGAT